MQRYTIAGLQVDMEAAGRTLRQAAPYATMPENKKPDLVMRIDPYEVLKSNPEYENPDLAEYMATGIIFARRLLEHSGFQLHASAVILDGKAYLFSAPCGTGKSTHTEKWRRLFGATLLNDDKPALRRMEEGWVAYGTPWSGKHDLSTPCSAPVGGIAFLQQSTENTIRRLSPGEAVPMLISQSPRYLTGKQMALQLQLLDQLLLEVPVWNLACRNEDAAAELSRKVMTEGSV